MTVLVQRQGQIQRVRDIAGLAGSTVTTLTSSGDVEVTVGTNGLILRSANGTRRRVTMDNDGNLVTSSAL